jgi:hypothetical protein
MRSFALKATAALILAAAAAGPAHATDDEQVWTGATATVKLSPKWRLSQEVVARFSDTRKGLYEIESNTLLGYKITDSVTLWAGYTHDPQYVGGDFTVLERRAREQTTIDNFATIGRGKLSGRLRMEQRWRENTDGTGWRARPYVKFSLPLRKGGKTALVLSNETFINLNTTSFQRTEGLDRMRNLIAINTPLTKTMNLEAGYLNQHGFVRNGEDTSDHVASLSLSLSL